MAAITDKAFEPFVQGDPSYGEITSDIAAPLEGKAGPAWYAAFGVAVVALCIGIYAVYVTISTGIGMWGLNRTVGWGFAITTFVFWIGIGHAGTLISAILLLFKQRWRTSIARSAEAMTIFAVMCAGIFPIIHMGRPWLAYWFVPYFNSRGPLWMNFRSPLAWDVFAISTYFMISLLFWYLGMVPDFASLRDRFKGAKRKIYGLLSLGWTGSSKAWQRHEKASLLLAGLAAPLVVSVHTIVSYDFAVSLVPGWHTTIFPPYFVAGAIFSGFAMVMTLLLVARKTMNLQKYITMRHLDNMAKIILATGMLVGFAYTTETFIAYYSGNPYEQFCFANRAFGPYAIPYWTMVSCNVISPQIFWFKKARSNIAILFVVSILVNIGMWFERFNIVVSSLSRDFLPSAWSHYSMMPTEFAIFIGSFGLFFTLFLLFLRVAPVIAIFEIKHTKAEEAEEAHHDHA